MTQPLTIRTNHNSLLAALYDQPAGVGPWPLVILLHGFTGWKEEEHIQALAYNLCQVGIAALRFDAPGSGESSGTWTDDYRMSGYLETVPEVKSFAIEHLAVDPHRLGIWGHSMGGFVALTSAAGRPRDFVAVCGAQPSNGWQMLPPAAITEWQTSGWATFSNSHFDQIRLPFAFYLDRQRYDALRVVPTLTIPSLFLAGTRDNIVSARSVRAMYNASPQPKTYLEFETDHSYKSDPRMLADINAATVDFFVRHLTSNN